MRRRLLRRRRLDLHLRLLAAAAGLVFVPLLSFSLGAVDESAIIAILFAALLGAFGLAEFLLAGSRPSDRDAARRLDALSGEKALFASSLDPELDQGGGSIGTLFRRQLNAAIEDFEGRDPLPRSSLALPKILIALVVLDAAIAAVPRRETDATDFELAGLRDYVVTAGESESFDPAQKEALSGLEEARTREEMIRRADELWRRQQAEVVDPKTLEEALDRLERNLERGEAADSRESAATLNNLIAALDRKSAGELAARLRKLATRFPGEAGGVDLDQLARAADGLGAGLAEGGPGSRGAARESMEKILVALYDGLGMLPPSSPGIGGDSPAPPRRRDDGITIPLGRASTPIIAVPSDRALIERYFRLRAR